ncbi:MAG TPA: protoglobin domain-containing protein [Kofleriaceae bacterium]|nr:protoglobin domain-containing protein [Kofleriaceae bacterium]
MGESLFEELCRYVRFGEPDQAALRALHPHAVAHFRPIADFFYDRIQEHEEATAVLRSPEQVERLKVSLVDWLDSLLLGPWDAAYFERRSRIGRMHVRVKLPQRYMFTAMAVIRGQLQDIAQEAHSADPFAQRAVRSALGKIIDLELAIMLETYGADTVELSERLQRLDRERLEQQLAASETRYHEVIENAEILIVGLDRAGRVVLFNRKAEAVTGRDRTEMLGNVAVGLVSHPDGVSPARSAIDAALAGRTPLAYEAPLSTRDGDERLVRWHLVPMPAASEIGVCAFGLDITETRRLEKASRRAERLAALGTLAAGLAHEIRNPLNSAHLQLTLAERRMARFDDPASRAKAAEAVQVVQQEVRRLAGMVEDFLAFARPRPLRIAPGDLRDTAREVVALLAPNAQAAGVTVELVAGDVIAARYDAELIKQVLHNLIRNAIEAASSGGRVQVALHRDAANAHVEVTDTGAGPPDKVDIFAPFTTTKQGGTGLGLPIVHRIVSDHAGEIGFERRGGRTVFAIEMPLDGPPGRPAAL